MMTDARGRRGALRRARRRHARRCPMCRNMDLPEVDDGFEEFEGELIIGPGREP